MGSGQEINFKDLTEGLKHMIFNYSAKNKNKNVFVENMKKLCQHIAVSVSIIHDVTTVAYEVRTLNAPAFEAPLNPEKNYKGVYRYMELREYLD